MIEGVTATGIRTHESNQIDTWRQEIRLLKGQLDSPEFEHWFIILEYEIPRRSRRPDAILLNSNTIFVIEFKIGENTYQAVDRRQAELYARDLRDFHELSSNRRIVPILCATEASINSFGWMEPSHASANGVTNLSRVNGFSLGSCIARFCSFHNDELNDPIDPELWIRAAYRPMPNIIEAAVELYEGHEVKELSHRYAYNLDLTTEMLVREIDWARRSGRHVICFITGVPGAGKTLTGLEVVHNVGLLSTSDASGVFLSGNGPLVDTISEAISRTEGLRGLNKEEQRRTIEAFIQNIHKFLRYHFERPNEPPFEHVVVFDEAQRAWDEKRVWSKRRNREFLEKPASEPGLLLDVMERLPDWAVIVALAGGGQEIYLGESGLEEWGRALVQRENIWHVVASQEVLKGGESVAGHCLFEGEIPPTLSFRQETLAHLEVAVRSHRAQRWNEWVNEFLACRFETARPLFPEDTREFPCYLTRHLDLARSWLRLQHRMNPDERIGLVASSSDQRLRFYGLERSSGFRTNYPFEKWFLDPENDIRSSFRLEVAASEFECQGLELDWVGVCWGGDLTLANGHADWDIRKFSGSRWKKVHKHPERAYTLNRYRVLLTRARKGLVIWVPPGDPWDITLDRKRFDDVFAALKSAGVPLLEDYFSLDELRRNEELAAPRVY